MNAATARTLVVIGLSGFDELIRWVAAGATPEQRRERGSFAKEAVEMALNSADHDQANKRLREQLAQRFNQPSATSYGRRGNWRN